MVMPLLGMPIMNKYDLFGMIARKKHFLSMASYAPSHILTTA